MTDPILRKTMFLAAPRQRVWDYLTTPDALERWFYRADAVLTRGVDYTLYGKNDDGSKKRLCWGRVTEADAPARLSYSFTALPMNGLVTQVVWTLDEVAGGTRLSLEHSGFPAGAEAFDLLVAFDAGWEKHLGAMRQSLS